MDKSQKLIDASVRLTSLVVQSASNGDHASAQKYEARLRKCWTLLAQIQSPGF